MLIAGLFDSKTCFMTIVFGSCSNREMCKALSNTAYISVRVFIVVGEWLHEGIGGNASIYKERLFAPYSKVSNVCSYINKPKHCFIER